MNDAGRSVVVRTKWTTLVAVCRECNGAKAVAKMLKRSYKSAGRRDVRIVRSSCLDVCPKRGVTVSTSDASGVKTVVIDVPSE
jgi:hypothetical protein